ncbi:MAG: PD40 domain-containing protein [Oligoflexales bacterium]|nr:PD40 domain-containing protein [Oligoflexales bacterium]
MKLDRSYFNLKKFYYNHLYLLYFLIFAAMSSACGSSNSTRSSPEPSRVGAPLSIANPNYYDGQASLTALGDRAVFISGRESGLLRTYKVDLAADLNTSSEFTPSLLHNLDLGQEYDAVISPNGQLVLFASINADGETLYLANYSGQGDPIKITPEASVLGGFSFSPDSNLIAFSAQTKDQAEMLLNVLQVSEAGTAESYKILTAEGFSEFQPNWIKKSSGYQIISRDLNSAHLSRSFSSFDALSEGVASTWVGSVGFYGDGQQTSVGEQVFIIKQQEAASDETLPLLKDNVFDDSSAYKIQNVLVELSASGTVVGSLDGQFGSKIFEIHGAENGSFAMAVSSLAYQCAAAAIDYGRIFNLIDLDTTSYDERLFIYLEDKTYKASSNPCIEGLTASSVDHSIALQAINANATRADFRALFITQKPGNPEILLLDQQGDESFNIFNISKNP